ncbi:MAG TPA: hypothetical protein DCP90_03410 [Clostridiales bacterium]|nr:MAG: hypothetical protein A2Y22_02990 [Clostridiales bacterium GWD2_32_59]HAN09644.1 hypothetical protein [Clostridiales bacterium]
MKIRIVGPCGSGKSYVAKLLSQKYEIPCYEIDDMVWKRGIEKNRFDEDIRNKNLEDVLEKDSWIIEGAQSTNWVQNSFIKADMVFILKISPLVIDFRIIMRFIKAKLGISKMNYNQEFSELIKMIVEWNHGYNFEKIKACTKGIENKAYWVKNIEDIFKIIEKVNEK